MDKYIKTGLKIIAIWGFAICAVFPGEGFGQQSKLKTYGFFDFEWDVSSETPRIFSFNQHHLNLITIYDLDNKFRVFTDFVWEHAPTVAVSGGYGKVCLTRSYLDYKYSRAFTIRIGKTLTPFGIYNERHDATPTFISTNLAKSIYGKHRLSGDETGKFYAKTYNGIQVLGLLHLSDWEAKYGAFISNGRGPNPAESDNNFNKGVGGRLVLSPPIDELWLGASYYVDRNGNDSNAKQSALGFDIEFDRWNAHIESELILPRLQKIDSSGAFLDDYRKVMGYYILGAYTFAEKFTPFMRYEVTDYNLNADNHIRIDIMTGINYSFTSKIYLKNEIQLQDFRSEGEDRLMYIGSIAVAF